MSTDEIKGLPTQATDVLRNYKGPFGIGAFIVALATVVVNMPEDILLRLRETWLIITIPSLIVLIGALGQAYLVEQRNRTRVEEKIYGKLDALATHFERMFDSQLDNKIYLDKSFDKVADEHKQLNQSIDRVFKVLEKRDDVLFAHSGDTEKFLHARQGKQQ